MSHSLTHSLSLLRRGLLALALAGLAGASLAQLSTGRTGANPGDQVRVNLTLGAGETRPLYLAATVGPQLYFFDENGLPAAYQPGVPTPRRLASARAGVNTLLTLSVPEGVNTRLTFYSVFGRADVPSAVPADVLAPGMADLATLQALPLEITAIPGGPNYAMYCESCHAYDPVTNQNNIQAGKDPQKIRAAIAQNMGEMGSLAHLSSAQVDAIAYWLQSPRFDCH